MSIGMFSVLPVPKNHWKESSLPWMLPLLPIVGGVIGILWYALAVAVAGLALPLQAAVVMLTPFVLTGFFHLDGYMDTADAVFSRRSLEEKKRILKDPHVGAFAVISLACLFIVQFCVVETILAEKKPLIPLLFIPVVSRCVVAFLLLRMKPMSETGFAAMLQKNTGRKHQTFPLVVLLILFPVAFLFGDVATVAVLAIETLVVAGTMLYLQRQFEGISGDLCGCAITSSELLALLAFC